MILVLGVWTFLRALLGHSTVVTIENIALRHQLMVLQRSGRPLPRILLFVVAPPVRRLTCTTASANIDNAGGVSP